MKIISLACSQLKKMKFIFIFFFALFHFFQSCTREPAKEYKKKLYFIAIPSRWQYTQLYDSEKNLVGFLSDLALSIGKKGGFSIRLIFAEPNDIPALLANRSIDACFTALPKNHETEQKYRFSNPIFMNGTVVVVSEKSPFQSLSDLRNGELAFDNTRNGAVSMKADASWFLQPSNNILYSLEKVTDGSIDGVILNYMQARLYTSSLFSGKYKILFPPIVAENISLIVEKKGPYELIEAANHFQLESIKSGDYKQRLSYWSLDMPIEEEILLQ